MQLELLRVLMLRLQLVKLNYQEWKEVLVIILMLGNHLVDYLMKKVKLLERSNGAIFNSLKNNLQSI